jgi:hypothetical protein
MKSQQSRRSSGSRSRFGTQLGRERARPDDPIQIHYILGAGFVGPRSHRTGRTTQGRDAPVGRDKFDNTFREASMVRPDAASNNENECCSQLSPTKCVTQLIPDEPHRA